MARCANAGTSRRQARRSTDLRSRMKALLSKVSPSTATKPRGFSALPGASRSARAGPSQDATDARVPLAAVLEPDADNDGFGDETQDACPQSTAFQTLCPLITLDGSTKVGRKAVTVVIAASSEGSVSVKGVAQLGKGKKVTLKAKAKAVIRWQVGELQAQIQRQAEETAARNGAEPEADAEDHRQRDQRRRPGEHRQIQSEAEGSRLGQLRRRRRPGATSASAACVVVQPLRPR